MGAAGDGGGGVGGWGLREGGWGDGGGGLGGVGLADVERGKAWGSAAGERGGAWKMAELGWVQRGLERKSWADGGISRLETEASRK